MLWFLSSNLTGERKKRKGLLDELTGITNRLELIDVAKIISSQCGIIIR
jgi:hypothetical protein